MGDKNNSVPVSPRSKLKSMAGRALFLESSLQLTGNRCLEAENCQKVLEYREDYLKLKTSTLIIEVWGHGFSLSGYGGSGVFLRGEITHLELTPRPGAKAKGEGKG